MVSECHPVPAALSALKHVTHWVCSEKPTYTVTIPTATFTHCQWAIAGGRGIQYAVTIMQCLRHIL